VSNCTFCGKAAGFFHSTHPDCVRIHENGKHEIKNLILQIPTSSASAEVVANRICQISEQSFISDFERNGLSVEAWSAAVDHSLHDGVLSIEVEKRLMDLKESLSLSRSSLEGTGTWDRVVKSAVIRDLLNGVIPKRMSFEGNLSLNLQKGEQIVWAFDHSEYLEDRTRRQYVGGSQGVSVRVMRGVYYHVGGFKGHAVDRTERVHVDTGFVTTTNKHIYFSGPKKTFRVPYTKIVSFNPFSDGVGIVRDSVTAKPQFFITHDGWFTYNLMTNLARL
jgi:hypothetical protein